MISGPWQTLLYGDTPCAPRLSRPPLTVRLTAGLAVWSALLNLDETRVIWPRSRTPEDAGSCSASGVLSIHVFGWMPGSACRRQKAAWVCPSITMLAFSTLYAGK